MSPNDIYVKHMENRHWNSNEDDVSQEKKYKIEIFKIFHFVCNIPCMCVCII